MKNKTIKFLVLMFLTACSSSNNVDITGEIKTPIQSDEKIESKPHQFLGWYCPDNLRGLPAVDITDWKNVPVVNGRMPTQEETQNGTSLIFVDPAEYPNAKPLDMTMPKLASFYNVSARREDLIIVIQAFKLDNDSIVGFRYLNGGNGTARLNEVKLLSDNEINKMPLSRFVSFELAINANDDVIWDVLTKPEYAKKLEPIFNKSKKLETSWREKANVNYHYQNAGNSTALWGEKVFGNFYIQNDYDRSQYTEKFMLSENQETKITNLIIVCGPFTDDFENQKSVLTEWAEKVKALSER